MSSLYISKKMEKLIHAFNEMPWENKDYYQNWLAQTHYYTRYSTRMLAMTAGWSTSNDKNLYQRSITHLKEESGHDVIAVNDLKNIGGELNQYRELGVTQAMWESQFQKILRNPSHLLGYILALETFAVQTFKPMHDRLLKTYPKNACMFVKVHAEDDPEHVEKAAEQIAQCPPEDREAIMASYDQTCDLYRYMLMSIREDVVN
jgi:hypothetical protein